MLQTAAACPNLLVIGIDASAASMTDASRRASRSIKRGGLANALFVVAAAGSLPQELDGIADALMVHFPWGSLLHGLLAAEPSILSSISRLTRPGARVTMLLSVIDHDRVPGTDMLAERTFAELAPAYAAHGLGLIEAYPATAEEIASSHSTWAKRLNAATSRPVWSVQFRRCSCSCL